MEALTAIWLMMLGAKYSNPSTSYAVAIQHAYDAAYRQSGMEQGVGKLTSYVEDRGRRAADSAGVNLTYPGAVAYAYKTWRAKSIDIPCPSLPTGCKPSVHAEADAVKLTLDWHF
jgi:hypothetical protein